MNRNLDHSIVEDLDLALRLSRRVMVRLPTIVVLGFAAVVGLAFLGTWLSPPYGLYNFGEDLMTWGLIALLIVLFAELWSDGRQIGRALNDPLLLWHPPLGLLSGVSVIAQRARTMGMEWSGFYGPLRPVRRT